MIEMKYSIYSSNQKIPENASELHLVRPIKAKKLIELMNKGIKKISMSSTTFNRLNKKVKEIAGKKNIELKVISLKGRAIGLGLEKVKEIISLYRDDKSFRKIEEKTGIPKSTAHYLIKYSKRKKLKNENKIIYTE
ncbi:MAG: hypothetical protein JW703_05150 [Candidatus Diapherotrites archaeon]|nr:hypothetical protein [Candidatus Diapherotrites archaeon]